MTDEAVATTSEIVVRRFLSSLAETRRLPDAEVAALLRVAEVDGKPAAMIRAAVADGRLFGAGLRDLVGRYALRGPELAAFVLREALEHPLAECARAIGTDPRTVRRQAAAARSRIGIASEVEPAAVGQWLVTELIAPPTRVLQLRLFDREGASTGRTGPEPVRTQRNDAHARASPSLTGAPTPGPKAEREEKEPTSGWQEPEQAEDARQAGLAEQEGKSRP